MFLNSHLVKGGVEPGFLSSLGALPPPFVKYGDDLRKDKD